MIYVHPTLYAVTPCSLDQPKEPKVELTSPRLFFTIDAKNQTSARYALNERCSASRCYTTFSPSRYTDCLLAMFRLDAIASSDGGGWFLILYHIPKEVCCPANQINILPEGKILKSHDPTHRNNAYLKWQCPTSCVHMLFSLCKPPLARQSLTN